MLLPFPQATANDKVGPCGPGVGNRSTCFVPMAEYPAVKQKNYHSREGGGVGEAGRLGNLWHSQLLGGLELYKKMVLVQS